MEKEQAGLLIQNAGANEVEKEPLNNDNNDKVWLAMDVLRIKDTSPQLHNEAEKVILTYLKGEK